MGDIKRDNKYMRRDFFSYQELSPLWDPALLGEFLQIMHILFDPSLLPLFLAEIQCPALLICEVEGYPQLLLKKNAFAFLILHLNFLFSESLLMSLWIEC